MWITDERKPNVKLEISTLTETAALHLVALCAIPSNQEILVAQLPCSELRTGSMQLTTSERRLYKDKQHRCTCGYAAQCDPSCV